MWLGKLVHNIRFGFATNSSSSHSMVFYKEPVASDFDPHENVDTEFGWDNFKLDSLKGKLMYALTQMVGSAAWSDDDVDTTYAQLSPLFPELSLDDFDQAARGYVDHQSHIVVDEEFLNKIRDPHVIIYGGNDNDGDYFGSYSWDEENLKTDYEYPAQYREWIG